MANINSQVKRNRQTKVVTERNKQKRTALKTLVANFNESVEKKDKKKATELFAKTSKALDKASTAGVIHAQRAASKKSTLSKRLNGLK